MHLKRIKKGMSQIDLAKATGLSRTFIQSVEKDDNLTTQRFDKLFKELDIKIK